MMFAFSASLLISVSQSVYNYIFFISAYTNSCLLFEGSFDPHLLVLLAYSLSVADRFPEELVREIFSIDFLGKLDAQLESMFKI